MGSRIPISPLLMAVPLLFAASPALATNPAPPAHERCGSCHVPASDPAEGSRSVGPTALACVSCHQDLADQRSIRSSHAGAPVVAVAPLGGPTFERFDCLACHAGHPESGSSRLRALPSANRMSGSDPLDELSRFCVSCHPDAAEFRGPGGHYVRHPVGVRPSAGARARAASIRLPLADVRGTSGREDDVVSCITCHEVHASRNAFLLRWSEDAQIVSCSACHPIGGQERDPADTALARSLR